MIARPLLTTAALALGLLAAAPAIAGSISRTQVTGYDNEVEVDTHYGAQLGTYVDGDGNTVENRVAGPGTRVVTGSLGDYTTTRMNVHGYINRIGSVARSGSTIDGDFQGDENEAALYARNGSRAATRVRGDGNYIRTDAR